MLIKGARQDRAQTAGTFGISGKAEEKKQGKGGHVQGQSV